MPRYNSFRQSRIHKCAAKVAPHIMSAKEYYFNEAMNDWREKQSKLGINHIKNFDYLLDIHNGMTVLEVAICTGQTKHALELKLLNTILKVENFIKLKIKKEK